MRAIAIGFVVLAGCGTAGPREERALLDDAEARSRRDVFAIYYSENDQGTLVSVVIPRAGPAEVRAELGSRPMRNLSMLRSAGAGFDVERRIRREGPVTAEQREAMEARFAAFPAGESEWTLPLGPPTVTSAFPGCGPETESSPIPATARMLHVSRTGEARTVIVHKGRAKSSARSGDERAQALDDLFWTLIAEAARRK